MLEFLGMTPARKVEVMVQLHCPLRRLIGDPPKSLRQKLGNGNTTNRSATTHGWLSMAVEYDWLYLGEIYHFWNHWKSSCSWWLSGSTWVEKWDGGCLVAAFNSYKILGGVMCTRRTWWSPMDTEKSVFSSGNAYYYYLSVWGKPIISLQCRGLQKVSNLAWSEWNWATHLTIQCILGSWGMAHPPAFQGLERLLRSPICALPLLSSVFQLDSKGSASATMAAMATVTAVAITPGVSRRELPTGWRCLHCMAIVWSVWTKDLGKKHLWNKELLKAERVIFIVKSHVSHHKCLKERSQKVKSQMSLKQIAWIVCNPSKFAFEPLDLVSWWLTHVLAELSMPPFELGMGGKLSMGKV